MKGKVYIHIASKRIIQVIQMITQSNHNQRYGTELWLRLEVSKEKNLAGSESGCPKIMFPSLSPQQLKLLSSAECELSQSCMPYISKF